MQLFNANGKRLAIGALVRSGPVVFAKTLKFDANGSCKGMLVIQHKPERDLIEEQKIVTL